MIIISKTANNQYKVQYKGVNGKILSTSECLTTKKNCWKNIYSTAIIFCNAVTNPEIELEIAVKDLTLSKPEVFVYGLDGIKKKAGARK